MMKLSKIKIKNFKSFEDISVELNSFNALIGACSSGKTNFIEIFKFLKDISQNFENGINKHGGPFLQNFNLNSQKNPSCLQVVYEINDSIPSIAVSENDQYSIGAVFNNVDYSLSFTFNNNNSVNLLTERVRLSFEIFNEDTGEKISQNVLLLKNYEGNVTVAFEKDEKYISVESFVPESLLKIVNNHLKKENVLMINSSISTAPISWASFFNNFKFHDFDPKFCKTINKINGNNELSEFGDTLPIVLDRIFMNPEDKRNFLNLLTILLPFVEDVEVEKILDNQRLFALLESYSNVLIPAPLVSDGTSNVMALICALYFEKSNVLFIEEPERNIHPALFIKLVEMIKEVSSDKQIIITTHSPEILKYCDLNDVFLISRNKNGFSDISKPIDNEVVKPFIEELGIDEVFVDNYLGLGNE